MKKFAISDLLYEDLVFIDFKATNKEQLISVIVDKLVNEGYVKKDYAKDVISRENKFPTALPTEPINVAIPHAENDHNVIVPAIVVVKLAQPVTFYKMGENTRELDVSLIFLLAVKGSKTQLSILPKLISIFSDLKKMKKLSIASSPLEILDVVKEIDDEK